MAGILIFMIAFFMVFGFGFLVIVGCYVYACIYSYRVGARTRTPKRPGAPQGIIIIDGQAAMTQSVLVDDGLQLQLQPGNPPNQSDGEIKQGDPSDLKEPVGGLATIPVSVPTKGADTSLQPQQSESKPQPPNNPAVTTTAPPVQAITGKP